MEGADWRAYRHRILHGAPALLCGVRFKGGDTALPFVDLLAWDVPLQSADDWLRAVARARGSFGVFQPRWVRTCLPGEAPPLPEAEIDQRLVGGRIDELLGHPAPFVPEGISLHRARDLSFLPLFQDSFERWQAGAGALAAEVSPATEASLRACLQDGVVVCAHHAGRWVGMMAARHAEGARLAGFEVVELFLSPEAQGRGAAPALQRALIGQLPGGEVLFGTIHGTNTPSLRTALRCGRRVIETWWFIPLGEGETR